MRPFILGLAVIFALALAVTASPVLAGCFEGHKTAQSTSPTIADGQTNQTPKPDQGS